MIKYSVERTIIGGVTASSVLNGERITLEDFIERDVKGDWHTRVVGPEMSKKYRASHYELSEFSNVLHGIFTAPFEKGKKFEGVIEK